MTRRAIATAVVVAAALGAAAAPAGAASYPKIDQLVVFRDGTFIEKSATAKHVTTRVGGRKCTIGSATALAALVRIKPPNLRIHDFGSCSRRARDAEQLFVRRIGPDTNKGFDGWVYKVGYKLATAGAGDPGGPFGRGRLKDGQKVLWFYCRLEGQSCQRTLLVNVTSPAPGEVRVGVRSTDDQGRRIGAAGATVHVGGTTVTADGDGHASVMVPPGTYRVHAERAGEIRSYTERIDVE